MHSAAGRLSLSQRMKVLCDILLFARPLPYLHNFPCTFSHQTSSIKRRSCISTSSSMEPVHHRVSGPPFSEYPYGSCR
ncbi:unnamed protein product [Somion occarium]|uniref:Uncharacterized protein n=1 Tax=Somion occarium TaxID=3059160 RepID=A0ABP1CYU6_9APHY